MPSCDVKIHLHLDENLAAVNTSESDTTLPTAQ
jgi:hypothetical protein